VAGHVAGHVPGQFLAVSYCPFFSQLLAAVLSFSLIVPAQIPLLNPFSQKFPPICRVTM
jgi:hypothetical protein